MRTITIEGIDYKIEYSIEASLYEDCAGCLMDAFINEGLVTGSAKNGNYKDAAEGFKSTLAGIPQRTLTLFYAGLMENHDLSKNAAKEILKKYIKESGKSYLEIQNELVEIVEEDNFFELIGLDKVFKTMESNTNENENEKVGKNTSTEQ